MDPCQTLGVAPDASPEDIRRAYRRMAMRWHPDRNPSPEATEQFKRIRQAYDDLLARQQGEEGDEAEEAEEAEAAPDAAPADTGASGGTAGAKAGDIRISVTVSLADAARGGRRMVAFLRHFTCDTCAGSGEAAVRRTRLCGACHGSGRVRAAGGLTPCSACGGRGFVSEGDCPDCGGLGHEAATVNLEIAFPPGLLAGDEVRVVGQGEPAREGMAAGDLFVTLIVQAHPVFALRGRDIVYDMPVSVLRLLAGGELRLPTPVGEIVHTLPPGDPAARDIRLKGQGFPGRGRHRAGDLVVRLTPVFPRQLDAGACAALAALEARLADDAAVYPELAAWRRDLA